MEHDGHESDRSIERRTFLKRSAIVAGATVWAAPTVQSLVSPAFATGTGRCATGHMVRFKYSIGEGFDSGLPQGKGANWCLPDGYTSPGIVEVDSNGCFTIEGQTHCGVSVTRANNGYTAIVTLPNGAQIEDLQAKAGSWHNGECDDAEAVNGNTASVTLEDKQISFVAGVFCF